MERQMFVSVYTSGCRTMARNGNRRQSIWVLLKVLIREKASNGHLSKSYEVHAGTPVQYTEY